MHFIVLALLCTGMDHQGGWVNLATELLRCNSSALSDIVGFTLERECPEFALPSFTYPVGVQSPIKISQEIHKAMFDPATSESETETVSPEGLLVNTVEIIF